MRQASEQYFTSSQFRAQRLRQVIAKPHCTHILLGKLLLLPLKERCVELGAAVGDVAFIAFSCSVILVVQQHKERTLRWQSAAVMVDVAAAIM